MEENTSPVTGEKRLREEEEEEEKKIQQQQQQTNNKIQRTESQNISSASDEKRKPIRVWVDGCFDMMHYGHANALRQAKSLGDYLIVGVHSDAEIKKNKGPTVMKDEERYTAVEACKWVDEIVRDAPYVTQLDMLNTYNADFCVHGDDVTTTGDGKDCYEEVKNGGRYKEVPRTTGVSTTDIVRRMLECTKEHFKEDLVEAEKDPMIRPMSEGTNKHSPYTGISKFIATSGKIRLFQDAKSPKPEDKIVYVDGAFDLFHIGHIKLLQKAKSLGDYLIVGVLDDPTVNRYKGVNYPIMNLYERVLAVLSCKYVDEVVIASPEKMSKEFIDNLKIQVVVHGSDSVSPCADGTDPYQVPKQMGLYQEVDSGSHMTTTEIITRIAENRPIYEARNKRKEEKEISALK